MEGGTPEAPVLWEVHWVGKDSLECLAQGWNQAQTEAAMERLQCLISATVHQSLSRQQVSSCCVLVGSCSQTTILIFPRHPSLQQQLSEPQTPQALTHLLNIPLMKLPRTLDLFSSKTILLLPFFPHPSLSSHCCHRPNQTLAEQTFPSIPWQTPHVLPGPGRV